MSAERRAIVWLAPGHLPLVRDAARAAELTIVAVGTPERGQAGRLATELASGSSTPEPRDDLRATLASSDADLAWIAAPGAFGTGGSDDAAAILAAHGRGMRIAAFEPIPASASDLAPGAWTDGTPCAMNIPRVIPGWPAALPPPETIAALGAVRALALEWWGGPGDGSLTARVYGAMEAVRRIIGEPESVDAACVGPDHGRGVHALPGETLRDLHGDMTANLRFSDGRAATIAVSDRAGRWERSLALLGPGGRVRVHDDAFEWIGPDGATLDESATRTRRKKAGDDAPRPSPAAAAVAAALTAVLTPRSDEPPTDTISILAMCHAALLSCRTGQPESPATIRRIAGAD
ncbi:MAG: hypothetical protein ACKVU4_10445 [Phycisphaerales bacterium]